MAEVVWSRRALRDLNRITSYIGLFAPMAAARMRERLIAAGASLDLFPERGRPVGHGARELIAVNPNLIRYRIDRERVTITRVRHGKRRPLS